VHVLTKLFIVLVSLLAVMLVPLVVVYAHNENSFQQRYQGAEAKASAARASLESAKASQGATVLRLDSQIQTLHEENARIRTTADAGELEVRKLEMELTEAESMDTEIRSQLATLVASVDAGQQLNGSLIDELRGIRTEALTARRQYVELDEAHRDALAQLDAAVEARRALQEQLQRLKEEHATALTKIQQYVAIHGEVDDDMRAGSYGGMAPDKDLDATVISVRRSAEQTYASIDAGSRDGVREGWIVTIGHGGKFIARLRITTVDINRSTGIVELEESDSRGRVEVGHKAYARAR